MARLLLRSLCVGLASLALAGFLGAFIMVSLLVFNSTAASPSGDPQEVGWDLLSVARGFAPWSYIVPLMIFVIGARAGYTYFSKRQARQGSTL
jgi:hypothetical protein